MRCPFCGHDDTQVKDSRSSDDGASIRRRRACPECDSRFTTFERIQLREMVVVKKNGARKVFDRDKLMHSIEIAVRKRPVTPLQVEQMVNHIVRSLETSGENEITTSRIGALVMDTLKEVDQVAYVRFASVYKDFGEIADFEKFVGKIQSAE